jgi:hypothetical protein
MTLLEASRIAMSLRATRRRPVDARTVPDDGEGLLPWYAFESVIDRSLAMLHGVHIPLSLFAVRSDRIVERQARAAIAAAWCRFGTVGRLPDARIGLLYLGPDERGGNSMLATHLRRQIERHLPAFDLVAVQCWSDEIDGTSDLLNLLDAAEGRVPRSVPFDARAMATKPRPGSP